MKIMVLASGRGTDFQAIADHVKLGILENAEICGLVCNHHGAQVTERAKTLGIPVFEIEGVAGKQFAWKEEREKARVDFDLQCVKKSKELGADYIVLAGFDQILSKEFVRSCAYRIINIHPAYDLEKFGGKNMVGRKVHELVVSSGEQFSGCTIHFVTDEIDLGPPILKKEVKVLPGDTPESLEERVLEMEHLAYPEAIQLLADDRVKLDESKRKCYVDLFSANWDIKWRQRQKEYLKTTK